MAEGFFRHHVEEAGVEIAVASAGVGAISGCPPSENSQIVMKELDIDITDQRSQQLTPSMVEEFSHIVGMAQSHIDVIRAHFPSSIGKTFVLRELLDNDSPDIDIPDPIGGTLEEYRASRDLIKEAMPSLFNSLLSGNIG